jgi:hypothetical protein
MTAAQTAFHLLYDVTLKFGAPEVIRSKRALGFVREMVAWLKTFLGEPVLHIILNP